MKQMLKNTIIGLMVGLFILMLPWLAVFFYLNIWLAPFFTCFAIMMAWPAQKAVSK